MNSLIQDLLPIIVVSLVPAISGYRLGRRDGYAEAAKDYLDNLQRQTTKNWYKRLHLKQED